MPSFFRKLRNKPWKRSSGGVFHRIPLLYEIILGILILGFFLVGVLLFWFVTTPIPDINDFETRRVPQSTKIYDRTGRILLYDVHGSIRRTDVTLDQISPYVQHAAIAIEDPNFYTDNGIELKAILRAVWVDLTTLSFSQGGSTITQQVVKNTILTSTKTIPRKLKEWVLAIKLDETYSKNQILDVYFNETPYGGTIYGIEEASEYFFGVHAKDLDLAQAAYLAALPQAPTYYSPYGNNRDGLDARKDLVLQKMYEQGYITADERDQAMNEKVTFVQENDAGIKAPHFVMYVLQYLEQKYGADAVDQNGLRVITTLDYDLEQKAEDIETHYAASNLKEFNASNAATVAVDPNTGQILAMVGSNDYFSTTIDGKYNDALAHRQPGSTFKPFVYATAFAKGYSPDTVLFNLKTQFAASCAPDDLETTDTCYSPDNYNSEFTGPMNLRDALAQSVNVVAVKLLYLVGINDAIETADRMGITTLGDAARYGLTLTLGGGEVTLLDMASAYGGFATDGIHHSVTAILEVDDAQGNVLEKYQDQSARVLDEQVARQVSDILSDNVARIPEFGVDSPLNFPGFDVADKTGTTNDSRDAWIIGYTPSIVVGSWAGNNDNSPMAKKIAGFIVAPMWHDIMQYAIEKYPAGQFIKPDPTPSSAPPIIRGQWNTPGPDGQLHSILYWLNPNTPLAGSAPGTSVTDPQFANWEYPIRIWAAAQGFASSTPGNPATNGPFRILSPGNGSVTPVNQAVTVSIQPADGVTITSISSYLNGALAGTANGNQREMTVTPTTLGPQTLEVVANGSFGMSSQTVRFSTHP